MKKIILAALLLVAALGLFGQTEGSEFYAVQGQMGSYTVLVADSGHTRYDFFILTCHTGENGEHQISVQEFPISGDPADFFQRMKAAGPNRWDELPEQARARVRLEL